MLIRVLFTVLQNTSRTELQRDATLSYHQTKNIPIGQGKEGVSTRRNKAGYSAVYIPSPDVANLRYVPIIIPAPNWGSSTEFFLTLI